MRASRPGVDHAQPRFPEHRIPGILDQVGHAEQAQRVQRGRRGERGGGAEVVVTKARRGRARPELVEARLDRRVEPPGVVEAVPHRHVGREGVDVVATGGKDAGEACRPLILEVANGRCAWRVRVAHRYGRGHSHAGLEQVRHDQRHRQCGERRSAETVAQPQRQQRHGRRGEWKPFQKRREPDDMALRRPGDRGVPRHPARGPREVERRPEPQRGPSRPPRSRRSPARPRSRCTAPRALADVARVACDPRARRAPSRPAARGRARTPPPAGRSGRCRRGGGRRAAWTRVVCPRWPPPRAAPSRASATRSRRGQRTRPAAASISVSAPA